MRRPGFTLIELLITLTVIVILVGLLMSGLSVLRRMRAKVASERLLSQVVYAMTSYLDANPTIDASAEADFNATPSLVWKYLGRGGNRLLELPTTQLGTASGGPVSDPQAAETILDGFGAPLVFRVVQGPVISGRRVPSRIEIASRNGTQKVAYPDGDDIIWRFDADGSTGLTQTEQNQVGKFWRRQ